MNSNITFVIFTYNEEKRVEYAIRNFIKYGEVILLDGGSTDKTREIAESLGAKFVLRPKTKDPQAENQEMLDFVRRLVKTDWIYWGYVDNLMPKMLLEKLTEISRQNKIKYVYIPIDTYLWGDTEHPMIRANYPCFFMKDLVDFSDNKMHGFGKFIGKKEEILWLPNKKEYAIRHYSLYDLNKFVMNHLKYAEEEARQRFEAGKRFSKFYMLASMARYFWLFYRRGCRAGSRGLFAALLYSFFRLMFSVKLYELEHQINLSSIEEKYAESKENLLKDLK